MQACLKTFFVQPGWRSKNGHFLSAGGEGQELVSVCILGGSNDGGIGCTACKRGDACFAIRSGNGCTAITVGRCQGSTFGVDLQIFDDFFFTQKGRCYWLKVYEIPEGTKNSKGRAIQNMLNIDADDKVNAFVHVKNLADKDFVNSHYLMFCTKNGVVKKTCLEAYSRPRTNGVNAITIREDDRVIEVAMTNGDNEIVLANKNGRAIRFHEGVVREMGRTATGVRGMTLDEDGQDEVVGMIVINDAEYENIMVVSEQGYGKRSDVEEYRITNRGGKGVKTLDITEKTGKLVAIKTVTDDNDLMIINKSGVVIRLKVADVRIQGRATQGVRLINLGKRNDQISSVCKVTSETEEPEVQDAEVVEGEAPVVEQSENLENSVSPDATEQSNE